MYIFFNHIHHYLSWLFFFALIFSVGKSWIGFIAKKPWSAVDGRLSLVTTVLMDLQVLTGIILYVFLSPLTKAAFADFGAAMGNSMLRFYAVEHILVMLIALALLHVGRSKMKKSADGIKKHRITALYSTIALVFVLSRIPWEKFISL